ncbi:26S proteasome complex subunit [Coemansia nantahalensis]|nr:26S proteasome complex subunit [Coemansia nantahalensis]
MAGAAPAAQQQAGALVEDDEFEEFEAEDWDKDEEAEEDVALWDDTWEEDDLDDDFSQQLRAELEKASQPEPMVMSS